MAARASPSTRAGRRRRRRRRDRSAAAEGTPRESSPRRASPSRYARAWTRPRARRRPVVVGRGGAPRRSPAARRARTPDGASHHVREPSRIVAAPSARRSSNARRFAAIGADRASGVGRGAGGRRSRANCFRRRAPATSDASDVLRGVAPESPAARDSRRRSRGGMSLSRTPVVASLVRCSAPAEVQALRAESGRAAAAPRRRASEGVQKSARPSACAECADAFFPADRSTRLHRRRGAMPRKVAAGSRERRPGVATPTLRGRLDRSDDGAGRDAAPRASVPGEAA